MSLETAIEKLADAIRYHADTLSAAANIPLANLPTGEQKPKRGRPPGSKNAEVDPPVAPPEPEVIAEAAPPVPTAPPAKPAKPAAPAPAAAAISKAQVQALLIEVVKQHGRDACGALCKKHGGPNLSSLDPSVYPALYADAQNVLSQEADPAQ